MYTIGTAGHVDHGKSALVQALTGIDPDRLQEEKRRGLTIDLGFAWLRLPSGREVSIVDVPGHERFIRNMLAGAAGIDLALLVIAADEGVMPQTREHLAILDILQVRRGIIVISKRDLVDTEWLAVVRAEVTEALAGTTLAGAPQLACSAITREGLDELVSLIERELAAAPPRPDHGQPRLPIDRVFTIAGFGTVVTGTLMDGSLKIGQEVEIVPGGLRSRVRGLQTHGKKVETAPPGRRTAINLPGIEVEQITRGMVVSLPGGLPPARNLDVRLRAVSHLPRPVRHNMEISLHSGAASVAGKLLLLDNDSLGPGEEGWGQVRLESDIAVARGDYFVIRDPNDTLGGGRIVDTNAPRRRRHHEPTLRRLALLEDGSPQKQLLLALERLPLATLDDLAREARLSVADAGSALEELLASGKAIALGGEDGPYMSETDWQRLAQATDKALAAYHREFPSRPGMPREELRRRLQLQPRPFDLLLERLATQKALSATGSNVGLPGHASMLPPASQAEAEAFLQALRINPYAPTPERIPPPDVLAYLEETGKIVRLGDGVVFAADSYAGMRDRIVAHLRQHGSVTLAQARDMFGSSRKYVQPLLESLDQQRLTRRVGDERVLR